MEDAQVKMGRPIQYDDEKHRRLRDWSNRRRESIRLGVPMRKPPSKKIQLICEYCGQSFSQWPGNLKKHPTSGKYCSQKCRQAALAGRIVSVACEYCGAEFEVLECVRNNGRGKYCGPRCGRAAQASNISGEKNHNWLGGVWLSSNGYRVLGIGHGKGRAEHKVVMEEILGRSLAKDEVVHHKNGNKTDNRPENLEVMTRAQHMRLHDPKGLRKESTV